MPPFIWIIGGDAVDEDIVRGVFTNVVVTRVEGKEIACRDGREGDYIWEMK